MRRKVSIGTGRLSVRALLAVLGLTFALQIAWNYRTERHFGAAFPTIYSVLYLPRGTLLDLISMGFRQTLADVIYLWSIQFYGSYENPIRYQYIHKIYTLIAELDPLYRDPYRLAGLICVYEERRLYDCALPILDLGLRNNPDAWEIAVDAGYYSWYQARDYKKAYEYFDKASRIPGAPPWTISWKARLKGEMGRLEDALALWRYVAETAPDSFTGRVAQSHIHDLQLWIQAQEIQRWVDRFYQRYGFIPRDLTALRQIGYTGPLTDPEGRPFRYNPAMARVEPHPDSLIFQSHLFRQRVW
ncbi:MAG: tetratricopeptide repeat protein [Acidobacteria bacterium]|nr:tetratricopeptide repeat protein [Acidobacteriota bacterium]MDW7984291.1 tetratricopeptide repeat protein [Acidobacteriota bacterium]